MGVWLSLLIERLTDYYPFGMEEPGRSYNSNTFRFGYTGHEKENDLAEGVYTTQYRLLDTRLGRWMSVDPLFGKYPDMSAYNYCGGNPVAFVDPDGGSKKVYFCQKMTSLQDKDYERNRDLQYLGNYILKDVKDVLFFVGHGVGDDGQKICMDNIDMRTFLQGFTYRYYSPEEFSKYVFRYIKSQQEIDLLEHPYVIVLVSCNTGKGDNKSFAAELSSDMYALVIAPSDIVSYNKSTKRTRIKNNGVWNVFVNGVKVDSFSGDTQLNDYFSGTMNGEELCEKFNFNFDGFTVEAEAKSKKSSNEPSKKQTIHHQKNKQ